jgi:23S rRNA (guanine2445-N2)-methyltransferase / 23S rRNA (guanine2069-N7)-methyltransferase
MTTPPKQAEAPKGVIVFKKVDPIYTLFAVGPGGLDEVLKQEVLALPAKVTHHYPGGVEFEGNLDTLYRACLELRTASRVLLKLRQSKKIFAPDAIYHAVQEFDWTRILDAETTFAIYFTESNSKNRREGVNTQFLALKVKDAIVDQIRAKTGARPSVEKQDPDITLRFHWHDHILKMYLDLSGRSLHERGYRTQTLEAPIKETLAAGLVFLSGWADQLKAGEIKPGSIFLDPFCGSGTILIEALLIATQTAPGLYRQSFGFMTWRGHDPERFDRVLEGLKAKRILDPSLLPKFFGSDQNPAAIEITRQNLSNAGFKDLVELRVSPFEKLDPPGQNGWMICNPPYGIRLGELEALSQTYRAMGSRLKHHYQNWNCGMICSDKKLLQAISLKPSKKYKVQNGGLDSEFFLFRLYNEKTMEK